jgi:hypothetical protein
MYLLDLGLGPYTDQPLDRWAGAFLPALLMRDLRHVHGTDGGPLVISETVLAPQRLPSPPAQPPDLRWPLLIAGVVLGLAFATSAWLRDRYTIDRWWFSVVGAAYVVVAGLAGALLLVLWFATAHRAAWANENLWLFNPGAWLLIPGLLRLRKPGARASRFALWVATALTLLAVFALASKFTPWFPQRNLPWILFGLPAWLGLLAGLWLMRPLAPRTPGPVRA